MSAATAPDPASRASRLAVHRQSSGQVGEAGGAGDAVRVSVLVGLLFGLAGMGSSSAAIALPVLATDLGISTGVSAWVISLYALALAVTTAVHGRVSDLVGIRAPMLAGVAMMATGAVLAALAPALPVLLGARLLQGAGAAAVPTLGVAVISSRYAGRTRALALGRVAGVTAAVSALGPLAGGTVTDLLGWRAVLALPTLGLLLVPLLWSSLPTTGSRARLDLPGAVLVAGTAAGLVLLVQSPSTGLSVGLAGMGLLLLGTPSVAWWTRRRPQGFLPRSVIGNGVVVRSSLAAAAVPAAWFALLIAVPAVLVGRGWEPWQVGLALVPSAVAGLNAPRFAGPLLTRVGPRRALGMASVTASAALGVAALGASWGLEAGAAVLLVLAVVCVTLAFGLGQPALMASVGDAVTSDVRGVALGVATLMFLVGGSVGSAVVGGFSSVTGMPASLLLLAVLPLFGALAVARRTRPAADPDPVGPDPVGPDPVG